MRYTFARQGEDVCADVQIELSEPTCARLVAALRATGAVGLAEKISHGTRRIELSDTDVEALRVARARVRGEQSGLPLLDALE